MSVFDVRDVPGEITFILFSEETVEGFRVAHKLERASAEGFVKIVDGGSTVYLHSMEHIENLYKAAKKAEELGWFD